MTRLITFEQTKIAEATQKGYTQQLKQFFDNSPIKDTAQLMAVASDDLQDILTDYLLHLKKRVKAKEMSANSVPDYFLGIKKILDVNGRENDVKWKQLANLYPPKAQSSGYKPWTTPEIQEMLSRCKTYRNKAVIYFLASTGGRRGIFDHELSLKHLVPMEYQGMKMYAVLLYVEDDMTVEERMEMESGDAVSGETYWSFLTPEASAALDDYLDYRKKILDPMHEDEPIFCQVQSNTRKHILKPLTGRAVWQIVERVVENTDISRYKKLNRFNTQLLHGFRKFFNTKLKMTEKMNYNIAEKLMAHKGTLDARYLKPTRQQCFEEYCKAIPELTISDSLRKEIELTKVESENIILQQKVSQIKSMEGKMQEMEKQLQILSAVRIVESEKSKLNKSDKELFEEWKASVSQ